MHSLEKSSRHPKAKILMFDQPLIFPVTSVTVTPVSMPIACSDSFLVQKKTIINWKSFDTVTIGYSQTRLLWVEPLDMVALVYLTKI